MLDRAACVAISPQMAIFSPSMRPIRRLIVKASRSACGVFIPPVTGIDRGINMLAEKLDRTGAVVPDNKICGCMAFALLPCREGLALYQDPATLFLPKHRVASSNRPRVRVDLEKQVQDGTAPQHFRQGWLQCCALLRRAHWMRSANIAAIDQAVDLERVEPSIPANACCRAARVGLASLHWQEVAAVVRLSVASKCSWRLPSSQIMSPQGRETADATLLRCRAWHPAGQCWCRIHPAASASRRSARRSGSCRRTTSGRACVDSR